jgi:hypothetical protein
MNGIVQIIINTMHLQERAYKTRKPRLRFEILACLVLNGRLTQGMTRSLLKHGTRSETIKAFNRLKSDGLIRKLDYKKFVKGRRQYYYKITEEALASLVSYDPHPLKFWKVLFGYCHHDEKGLTPDKIDGYYNLFISEYLKYSNVAFSIQLDIFDIMCDQWLRKVILEKNKLGIEQKIIEVLAIDPGISLKEIVKKTKASEYKIKKCLTNYTLKSYRLSDEHESLYQGVVARKYHKKYWEFLLHSVIVANWSTNNGTELYRLTLVGIMLALTIIRCKDRYRLKHDLYYKDISLQDYYDAIAQNYQHKLPLIFGKWNLLKDILSWYSAYNFDILLDKELRFCNSVSVIRGENKELFDSILEMALQNRQQILDLVHKGMLIELKYISTQSHEKETQQNRSGDYLMDNDIDIQPLANRDKISGLTKKLDEIKMLLNPLKEIPTDNPEILKKISIQLEEQLANEITAFYYFHLYSGSGFRTSEPSRDKPSILDDPQPKSFNSKECLSLLIKNDVDEPLLSEWFYNLIEEINSLQKEIYNALPKRPI